MKGKKVNDSIILNKILAVALTLWFIWAAGLIQNKHFVNRLVKHFTVEEIVFGSAERYGFGFLSESLILN